MSDNFRFGGAMLQDVHGRFLRYLRISVTDRCNLRCVYCLPASGVRWQPREALLRYEEIAAVVRVAVSLGITRVRLTGGEPLVRVGLPDLIATLAAVPGLEDLALTTNGVLLAAHAAVLARAGLRRVNISLDTLQPAKFSAIARCGALSQVKNGIEAALAAGLSPVKLNVVVMRGVNDDELVDLARLAMERPLHVRFIELMPIGEYFTPERLVPADEILARLTVLGPLQPAVAAAGCGPARSFAWPGALGTVGVISAVTQAFCAQCNRLRLTATGRLRPCLDDDAAVDLLPALRPAIDAARLRDGFLEAARVKPAAHSMAQRETGQARMCMAGVGG